MKVWGGKSQSLVPGHGERVMPRLGRQWAERCPAKLGRGAARTADQRSLWGRAGALPGLEAGGHRGSIAVGWSVGDQWSQWAVPKEQRELASASLRQGDKEGALVCIVSPGLTQFCYKTDASVGELQHPKFQGSSGLSFPIPSSYRRGQWCPQWRTSLPRPPSESSYRNLSEPV